MLRRLLRLIALVSALLCIGVCYTWRRSNNYWEMYELTTPGGAHWCFAAKREIGIEHEDSWPEQPGMRREGYVPHSPLVLPERSIYYNTTIYQKKALGFRGAAVWYGSAHVVVDDRGAVLRMPPMPTNPLALPLSPATPFWAIAIPYWMAVALFAIAPIVFLVRFAVVQIRRRVRRQGDFCAACGYDLRASLDRCPECGNPRAEK